MARVHTHSQAHFRQPVKYYEGTSTSRQLSAPSYDEVFLLIAGGPGWLELPIFDCRLLANIGTSCCTTSSIVNRQSSIANRQSAISYQLQHWGVLADRWGPRASLLTSDSRRTHPVKRICASLSSSGRGINQRSKLRSYPAAAGQLSAISSHTTFGSVMLSPPRRTKHLALLLVGG